MATVNKNEENSPEGSADVLDSMATFAGDTVTKGLNMGIETVTTAIKGIDPLTAAELGQKISILLDALPVNKFLDITTKSVGELAKDGINVGLNAVGVIPGAGEVIELIRTLSNMVHAGLNVVNTGIQIVDTGVDTAKEVNSKIKAAENGTVIGKNPGDARQVLNGLWDKHGDKLTHFTGSNSVNDFINKGKQHASNAFNTSKQMANNLIKGIPGANGIKKRITMGDIKNNPDMVFYINRILAAIGLKKPQTTLEKTTFRTKKPLTIADIEKNPEIYTDTYLNKKLDEYGFKNSANNPLTIDDILNNKTLYTDTYLTNKLAELKAQKPSMFSLTRKQKPPIDNNISLADQALAATGAKKDRTAFQYVTGRQGSNVTTEDMKRNPGKYAPRVIDSATTTAHAGIDAMSNLVQPTSMSGKLAKGTMVNMAKTGATITGKIGKYGVGMLTNGGQTKKMIGGLKKIKRFTRRRDLIGGRILESIQQFKTKRITRQ